MVTYVNSRRLCLLKQVWQDASFPSEHSYEEVITNKNVVWIVNKTQVYWPSVFGFIVLVSFHVTLVA